MKLPRWPASHWFLLISLPIWTACSIQAASRFRNDLESWLSPDSPARRSARLLESTFGGSNYLVVSWPNCQLDSNSLRQAEAALNRSHLKQYVRRVLSGSSLKDSLVQQSGLSELAATDRVGQTLLGPDKTTTGIIISLTRTGSRHRKQCQQAIRTALVAAGVADDTLRMGGPAAELRMIDYEGFWSPFRAFPYILVCTLFTTRILLGQWPLTCFILGLSISNGLLALTLVCIAGIDLNAIVWTLPTLIYLLTISASLHFLGYYRDAYDMKSIEASVQIAVARARLPTWYCGATTAVGMFSLIVSQTRPVQQFGVFGAMTVLASCGTVLWCVPNQLRLQSYHPPQTLLTSRAPWIALSNWTLRHRTWIILATLGSLVVSGIAIPQLQMSANIPESFPSNSQIIQDTRWIEQHAVPLSSIEVILRLSPSDEGSELSRVHHLAAFCRGLDTLPFVRSVYSAIQLLPELPVERSGLRGVIQRRVFSTKIRQAFTRLQSAGVLARSDGVETWRFSLGVSTFQDIDVPNTQRRITALANQHFQPLAAQTIDSKLKPVDLSGPVCIVHAVESQFLHDLVNTYATAFVVIAIAVLVLLRSFRDWLVVTIPNAFPAIVVLGGASLLGRPLDVASLMTASVALGISVDDTMHFMLWQRKKAATGMAPHQTVSDTLQHCGYAMLQTSVICGLSLAFYAVGQFLPTVRFGLLLAAMLMAALLGDLLILPALLQLRSPQPPQASESHARME